MFEIVGKLRYPVCSNIVKLEYKVFLDTINTIIHQKCYYTSTKNKFPVVDQGVFKKMLLKYVFFNEDI